MSATFFKRDIPLLIIVITGVLMLLWRFIDHPVLKAIYSEVGYWSSIISLLGWGLAIIYLFQGEYYATKQNPTFVQKASFVALSGFSLLLVGMALYYPDRMNNPAYQWWYQAFYRAQSTAYYGLMFLYLCSASYRMLRARSLESIILMAAGLLYLMRSSSMFAMWFPWVVPVGEWIMNFPNTAATTAAVICMAFGQMLIATRQMLGRERTAIEVA